MQQENESGRMRSDKPNDGAPAGRNETSAPSAYKTAGGIVINFQSAEFNHVDNLNDYGGNYRFFQPLDGIITADMRHQMERPRNRDEVNPLATDTTPSKINRLESDLLEASEAASPLSVLSQAPFTAFLKNRCLHGRSHTHSCNRCIEICPFSAIQFADQELSINHALCQGCGGCTVVCPADAIYRLQPSQEELLNRLRYKFRDRPADIAFPPILMISDSETGDVHKLLGMNITDQDCWVDFAVEQIGYVGLEILLAALNYGAGKVVVACGSQNPPKIREAVEWQVQMAGAILRGLDMPEDIIRLVIIPDENSPTEKEYDRTSGPGVQADPLLQSPAVFTPPHDRRAFIRRAAQRLYDKSNMKNPLLPLPSGAPFGAVTVNKSACTLCMACAVSCPSGALSASGDVPRLTFIESRCHQCGLCEETCPEGAINLLPRMLCDPEAIGTPVALNEAEPFRCIKCGAPFATQAMINHMQKKLTGHWMYADDRQLNRLQMCGACRTQDALSSQDVKLWNRS